MFRQASAAIPETTSPFQPQLPTNLQSRHPLFEERGQPSYSTRYRVLLFESGLVSPRLPLTANALGTSTQVRRARRRVNARERDDSPRGIPSFQQVAAILLSEAAAVEFLIEKEIVDLPRVCNLQPGCKGSLRFKNSHWRNNWKYFPFVFAVGATLRDSDCWMLRCTSCRRTRSLFSGTFFSGTHLSINQVLTLLYSFARSESVTLASELAGCSRQSATQWYVTTRKLLQEHILCSKNSVIGGPGRIVQIDEAKFGKRKYNRGHRVEGNWVFGGIEYIYDIQNFRFKAGKTFCVVVPKRDFDTLFPIIGRWILPGTLVWSDAFKTYQHGGERWRRLGLDHEMVVHEHEFVSVSGVHTNAIEGLWFHLKANIPNRIYHDAEDLQLCLYAEVFLRNHSMDRWASLIGALKLVRYDQVNPSS